MDDRQTNDSVKDDLEAKVINPAMLDQLAANLVWRIGRLSEESPITVRIGLASNVALFNTLPKLRSATESEIELAIKEDALRVEWVGRMPT